MIVSHENLLRYLTAWLSSQVQLHRKKGFLLPVTDGIDSILSCILCLEVSPPLPVTLIMMGFKQENEIAFKNWLAKYSNHSIKIISPEHPETINMGLPKNVDIRQSMLSAYIDLQLKVDNYIAIGTTTKSEYSLLKNFSQDVYDSYPLIDLYRSEIIQLAQHFDLPKSIINSVSLVESSFGFSYSELEWLDRDNQQTNIITSSVAPNSSRYWAIYTDRQKTLIEKVYTINKLNLHKNIAENKMCMVSKALPGALS